ncbi:MAG: hypothetical protein EBX41_11375, partial [Chitinophagia bacterium]|nr:hypothetical protein [Chitinophagia bacterium]
LSSLAIPDTKAPKQKRKITVRIFKDSWNLLTYVYASPQIFRAICGVSWFWLLGAVFLSQMPVLVKQSLNGDEGVTTLLLSLFTIGIAIGSVLCNSIMKGQINTTVSRYGTTMIILLTVALSAYLKWYPNGLPETAFSLTTFVTDFRNIPVAMLGFAIAVAGGLHIVPLYSFIQKNADGEYRARVVAANNIMNSLFIVASSVLTILVASAGGDVIAIFFLTALSGIPVLYYGNKKHSA